MRPTTLRLPGPTLLARALVRGSLLASVLAAGCNKAASCKTPTLSVELSCTSSLQLASATVRVTDRATLVSKTSPVPVTCPGTATGEIAFSPEEAEHSVTIAFEAQDDANRPFEDHRDLTLSGGCDEITLQADRPPAAVPVARCLVTTPFTAFDPIPTFASNPTQSGSPFINLRGARWSPDDLEVYALLTGLDGSGGLSTSEILIGTRSRVDDLPGNWIQPVPRSILSRQFAPTVPADGLQLFFEGWTDDGDPSIYRTTRATKQAAFGPPVAVIAGGGSPYVVPSGKAIYYDILRPGSDPNVKLDLDLYVAALSDGVPSGLRKLDSLSLYGIVDANPVLTDDELAIYFTSSRPPSLSSDIWMATRESVDQDFGSPTLVKELQTANEDAPWWLSSDRCRLYTAQGIAIRNPPDPP